MGWKTRDQKQALSAEHLQTNVDICMYLAICLLPQVTDSFLQNVNQGTDLNTSYSSALTYFSSQEDLASH